MKHKRLFFLLVLTASVALGCYSFGTDDSVTIYHARGNGTYAAHTVNRNSLGGHANHEGDRWYRTLCPLSGPEDCE
jgi:hypothetical protein